MKKVKNLLVGLMIMVCLISTISFKHKSRGFDYFVTGIDPSNNNYIVTHTIKNCQGPHNVACEISSTTDATIINGKLEIPQSSATILFYAFSF